MQCPRCETENPLGATYCAGCGAKLELTDDQAHAQALAAVHHENWEKAFKALNRVLFLFLLAFIGSLLFRAYATRPVSGEFNAGAVLPPPPPLVVTPAMFRGVDLPLPALRPAPPLRPDRPREADILADLAQTARDRRNCSIQTRFGSIKGVLLKYTADKYFVITDWGPPLKVRAIRKKYVDPKKSQGLPEN